MRPKAARPTASLESTLIIPRLYKPLLQQPTSPRHRILVQSALRYPVIHYHDGLDELSNTPPGHARDHLTALPAPTTANPTQPSISASLATISRRN